MSAPLVVNTRDGACWTRRAVTEGGIALYALADVCKCPEFVMATLPELAERGIVGSADVLPMPVGPAPQESGPRSFDLVGEVTADDYDEAVYAAEQAYSGMRGAGYTGSVRVDVGDERAPAEDVALHLPETALGQVQAILLAHYDGLPRPDMAVGLLLTNLRAELLAEPADGGGYPPALPWARQMDADDLEGFLADLADAASGDDDLTTLGEVESAIARWRVIGEAQHAHNTAPGPDAKTGGAA